MLKEVKHLAKVSCKVPARDTSDATLCQDDNIAEEKCFLEHLYYYPKKQALLVDYKKVLLFLLREIAAYCFFEKKPAIDVEFISDGQLQIF